MTQDDNYQRYCEEMDDLDRAYRVNAEHARKEQQRQSEVYLFNKLNVFIQPPPPPATEVLTDPKDIQAFVEGRCGVCEGSLRRLKFDDEDELSALKEALWICTSAGCRLIYRRTLKQ